MRKLLPVVIFLTGILYAQDRIVYASNEAGSYDIYLINDDGSNKKRLTIDDQTQELAPKFSPDSKHIAFYQDDRLMIMDDNGENPVLVADIGHYFYLLEWSQSDWIYLSVNSLPGCFPDDLRRIRPEGDQEEILLSNMAVHGATEGPYGEILYVKAKYCWTPASETRIFDPINGTDRIIWANDGKAEFWPTYSSLLDQVAFHQSDSPRGFNEPVNLYTMDWDAGNRTAITNSSNNESFLLPAYSPDNLHIVSSHAQGSEWDLAIMETDGSNLRFIDQGPGVKSSPDYGMPNCKYAPDTDFTFLRQRGKPVLETRSWDSCGGPGLLEIDGHLVASAHVFLNGQLIAGPDFFNQNVTHLGIEVNLETENVLTVEMAGKPGGLLSLSFIAD